MVNHDTKLRTRMYACSGKIQQPKLLTACTVIKPSKNKCISYMIAIFEKSQSIVITSKICNKGQILEFSHLKATLAFNVHSLQ